MKDGIYDIASELAKKEMKFTREDEENQDRLKELLNRIDSNFAEIEEKVKYAVATIVDGNPNIEVNTQLFERVINNMKKQMSDGKISSIDQIKSNEFVGTINQAVINDYTVSKTDRVFDEMSSPINNSNTMTIIDRLISDSLSMDELGKMANALNNSDYVKNKLENYREIIINSNSPEERENAAIYLGAQKLTKNNDYFTKNKGTKSDRGAIFKIMRYIDIDSPDLDIHALILARQIGMEDVINPDGTINAQRIWKKMQESVKGNTKLEERFSTFEKFKKEIKAANKRGAELEKNKIVAQIPRRLVLKEDEDDAR